MTLEPLSRRQPRPGRGEHRTAADRAVGAPGPMAGNDDPILPLVNAQIMHRLIPRTELTIYHGGHLDLVPQPAHLAPSPRHSPAPNPGPRPRPRHAPKQRARHDQRTAPPRRPQRRPGRVPTPPASPGPCHPGTGITDGKRCLIRRRIAAVLRAATENAVLRAPNGPDRRDSFRPERTSRVPFSRDGYASRLPGAATGNGGPVSVRGGRVGGPHRRV
jgi:hypothetical protein